jgi:hypothetical protein
VTTGSDLGFCGVPATGREGKCLRSTHPPNGRSRPWLWGQKRGGKNGATRALATDRLPLGGAATPSLPSPPHCQHLPALSASRQPPGRARPAPACSTGSRRPQTPADTPDLIHPRPRSPSRPPAQPCSGSYPVSQRESRSLPWTRPQSGPRQTPTARVSRPARHLSARLNDAPCPLFTSHGASIMMQCSVTSSRHGREPRTHPALPASRALGGGEAALAGQQGRPVHRSKRYGSAR